MRALIKPRFTIQVGVIPCCYSRYACSINRRRRFISKFSAYKAGGITIGRTEGEKNNEVVVSLRGLTLPVRWSRRQITHILHGLKKNEFGRKPERLNHVPVSTFSRNLAFLTTVIILCRGFGSNYTRSSYPPPRTVDKSSDPYFHNGAFAARFITCRGGQSDWNGRQCAV